MAWLESSSTDKVRADSLIVGDVKYSLRDALVSGTILTLSSKQIELLLTLELLFGRSGLSFFSRINQASIKKKQTLHQYRNL